MEHIATPKVENVQLLDNLNTRNSSSGTLYITTTHLIFVSPEEKEELWILHMHLNTVDKLPLTTGGSPIRIACSDFRVCTFLVHRDKDAQDIYTSLVHLSRPVKVEDLYCFQYRAKHDLPQHTGWTFFDLGAEFARQGLPNSSWVNCSINLEWRICPTYPSLMMVPATATSALVVGSAKFRSKGRLPVLTYYHSATGAALVRCSQPLSGLKGRSPEDEKYISSIVDEEWCSKLLIGSQLLGINDQDITGLSFCDIFRKLTTVPLPFALRLAAPMEKKKAEGKAENEKEVFLGVPWALGLLLVTTVAVAFLSEYLIASIKGLVDDWGVPPAFVGVILLPIVGNACEHLSAVRMASIPLSRQSRKGLR